MIIGLTGTIASGKSTVAKFFKKRGYEHFTYSDILRIEADKRNISPSRENLQALGNKVKEESHNLGILSRMIIENAKKPDIIADGIRTVDEISELRKNKCVIIGVDASQKTRYNRLKNRKRKGDPTDFNEFKKIDDHENKGLTPGQEINKCLNKSDFIIKNDGSYEDLIAKIEEIHLSLK